MIIPVIAVADGRLFTDEAKSITGIKDVGVTTKKLAEASFYHAGQVMMPDSLLASPGVNVVAVLRRSGLTGGVLSITTGGPRDGPASEEGFRGVKGIGELIVQVNIHEDEIVAVGSSIAALLPSVKKLH